MQKYLFIGLMALGLLGINGNLSYAGNEEILQAKAKEAAKKKTLNTAEFDKQLENLRTLVKISEDRLAFLNATLDSGYQQPMVEGKLVKLTDKQKEKISSDIFVELENLAAYMTSLEEMAK